MQYITFLLLRLTTFPNFQYLILTNNRVLSLSDVRGTLTIPYLSLTNNQIGHISDNELLLQTSWVDLNLSDNSLTKANFSLPSTIRRVFLMNNYIDHVLFGSLNAQIDCLFLSNNKISSLSFTNYFPNLVSFNLSGKPDNSSHKRTFQNNKSNV